MPSELASSVLRRDFSLAADSYDAAAVLARETGLRMAQRLDYIKIAPGRVADIGCATGDGIRELQKRYPRAQPLAIDFALPMLRAVRQRTSPLSRITGRGPRLVSADVRALPIATNSLGLVWSNLLLHWITDPLPVFKELHRVLEVGGMFSFSTLGPDTLKELRASEAQTGICSTARTFIDMHDLGDMMLAAGFADPVMDMEIIRFHYSSPLRFLADQRQVGVRDALLGSKTWREWRKIFAGWEREGDHFPVSFEVVFGHAWKARPTQMTDGVSIINFHRP